MAVPPTRKAQLRNLATVAAFAAISAVVLMVIGKAGAMSLVVVLSLVVWLGTLLYIVREVRASATQIDRRKAGQCLYCGYDLRASPVVCPECGRPARAISQRIVLLARPSVVDTRLNDLRADSLDALAAANEAAQRRLDDYVGTEHLLHGLAETSAAVRSALADAGVADEDCLLEIPTPVPALVRRELPYTPAIERCFSRAFADADRQGGTPVTPFNLLMRLVDEADSAGGQVIGEAVGPIIAAVTPRAGGSAGST